MESTVAGRVSERRRRLDLKRKRPYVESPSTSTQIVDNLYHSHRKTFEQISQDVSVDVRSSLPEEHWKSCLHTLVKRVYPSINPKNIAETVEYKYWFCNLNAFVKARPGVMSKYPKHVAEFMMMICTQSQPRDTRSYFQYVNDCSPDVEFGENWRQLIGNIPVHSVIDDGELVGEWGNAHYPLGYEQLKTMRYSYDKANDKLSLVYRGLGVVEGSDYMVHNWLGKIILFGPPYVDNVPLLPPNDVTFVCGNRKVTIHRPTALKLYRAIKDWPLDLTKQLVLRVTLHNDDIVVSSEPDNRQAEIFADLQNPIFDQFDDENDI